MRKQIDYLWFSIGGQFRHFAAMWMIALATVLGVAAAEQYADFTTGVGTNGWTLNNGAWNSPTYAGAVDRIELQYAGADADASATVQAFPEQGEGVDVAMFTAASSSASFDFPETTAFRSFRITSTSGLALSSFTAYVAANSLDVPTGVAISNNVTGTSFDASWNAVEGATGYRVYVWTNAVVGASEGTVVWQETFANSPAKTTTVNFKADFTDDGTCEWGFDKAYASISNGAVRIGTTSDKGYLVSPPIVGISGVGLTLRVTAWRQTTSDGTDMPVGVVSGGITNIADVVVLGDEPSTYYVALPAFSADDSIAIFSPTNKKSARAIIDDVAIVSGYSEGHPEPSYIVSGLDVGAATAHSFSGLPSVPVQFAVEAYGRRGASSEKAEAVVVDLSNPDKVAVLNACPLSSLTSSANTYTQNFDSLASLTKTSSGVEWLNGVTLPYWQAYCNGGSVGTLKWNAGSALNGGLYALVTNQSFSVRALGARSTTDKEFSWGIAFTNDTGSVMTLSSLEYSAQQWGFSNKTNQTLSVSVRVADGLDWIYAYGEGWTTLHETMSVVYGENTPQETPVSEAVSVASDSVISIAPGQVLMLKWTAEKKAGTPGVMGIDDVTVTFGAAEASRGLVIKIADSNH